MRRSSVALLIALAAVELAACIAGNGDTPDAPIYEPPEAGSDARTTRPTEDGGAAPTDAAPDAKKATSDASSDAATPPSSSVVRIQEVYVDHDGLGDGAEYVELTGPVGTPVSDLALRLVDATGTVAYDVSVGDAGDVIGASGTWVVGGTQTFKLGVSDRVDHIVSLASWGIPNERGAVQLVKGTTLLDVLGYVTNGSDTAAAAPTTNPKATSEGLPAVVPTIAKHALGRKKGAADSDQNRTDFCAMAATPGSAQQAACD